MMVAMNPQTWDADLAEIEPGGYLFYDSTRPLPASKLPRRRAGDRRAADRSQRHLRRSARQQLFKNIMYVGALSVLLDVDAAGVPAVCREQYRARTLLDSNVKALPGHDYVRKHLGPIGIRVEKRRMTTWATASSSTATDRRGLGMVYGGATVAAPGIRSPFHLGSPGVSKYCDKFRTDAVTGRQNYAIVQAGDELASIGMVVGAGWNGARAFTATSGPGISLMTEFIGLPIFAEIPVTVLMCSAVDPSTGMPTRTQQSDLFAAYASHGDTKHVLLFRRTRTNASCMRPRRSISRIACRRRCL